VSETSSRADRPLTVITYVMLVLFGMAQAVLGTFFYGSGPAPLASLGFDVAIFATCVGAAWGMRRPAGALAPAAGWFAVVFVLASGTSSGSVLVTASVAGEWFLFGGAVSIIIGLIVGYVLWSRSGRGAGRGRPLGPPA